jgi:hypothetical protein
MGRREGRRAAACDSFKSVRLVAPSDEARLQGLGVQGMGAHRGLALERLDDQAAGQTGSRMSS